MADLQETLSKRERRSKVIAVVVGVVIVGLLILALVIGLNNNNTDESAAVEDTTEEVVSEIGQEADEFDPFAADTNDQTQGTTVDVNDSTANDEATSTEEAQAAETPATVGVADVAEEDLPNTGPVETTLAIFAGALAYFYYKRSRETAKAAQLK